MTLDEPPAEPPMAQRTPLGLSFGDGFQFGCGFFLAGLIALLIVLLVILLALLLLSLAGVTLFGNSLGGSSLPGLAPLTIP